MGEKSWLSLTVGCNVEQDLEEWVEADDACGLKHG